MAKTHYPKIISRVDVTFQDGEVKSYEIEAGARMAPYLAEQCGRIGALVLLMGAEAVTIPTTNIREWSMTEISYGENNE